MKSAVQGNIQQGLPQYFYSRNSNHLLFCSGYCEILSKVKKRQKVILH